ncbi:SMP-30/gluconolactonase/LRE family protein [Paraflavisolibacter sp. H34]|uniref:SMP-30/gluconolactonase/LRE family protein n=1 Tax=Huijunlia imazamoxiresistens TaxID=3127457 RepID=UPI003018F6B1
MSKQDTSEIIAPGARLQLLSSQFAFTEGPAPDREGAVYFTDQPNDQIWKWSPEGALTVFLDKAGRSNGLYLDREGNLLACADEHNELWSIGKDKKIAVLARGFKGRRLNGPNDLWIHPGGGIYFTDPYYQRPYWTRQQPELEGEKVFYLGTGRKEPVPVAEDLEKPNGIIGTPDGRYLYVADIGADKTYRYTIAADGSLEDRRLFLQQGSDGMTLDHLGNVYLTGNGITVYNPEGRKIAHIQVPAKWTANVCFGGKEKKTLFITASESIYLLEMNVHGVE